MNSASLKALQDANLATNNTKNITAADVREFTTELIRAKGGWFDYDNNGAEQELTGVAYEALNNDGLGSFTNTSFKPYWVTSMLTSNEIDLSDLEVGTIVMCRFQFTCNPTASNQYIDFRCNFKNTSGVSQFTLQIEHREFKASGTKTFSVPFMFYVGSTIEGGSVAVEANPSVAMGVTWDGVVINITE